jgi:DNA invertase Pin-like site-specific DNA recombinase
MAADSETATARKVGYARVSTNEQDLQLQLDALAEAGVANNSIYSDKISGSKAERPGLEKCLASLHDGDTLIVWRLDRLGRSMIHLVTLIAELRDRGVGFQSISDGVINTTSASGELVFNIFSALAQFERRLIQERTQAGLIAARSRGRFGGRPKISPKSSLVRMASEMHRNSSVPIDQICSSLGISRATFYRYVNLAISDSLID